MTAQVDIFNYALTTLGAQPVSSPTDNSKNARACLQVYDMIRQAELRKQPGWNFAIQMAKLAPSPTKPLFDRAYSYPLPADFLALLTPFPERNYPDRDWVIQEGQIYTNNARLYTATPYFPNQPPFPPLYNFSTSTAFAQVGAVYSAGGFTFQVLTPIFGTNILNTVGSFNPPTAGTLTLVSGVGDATITYSMWVNPPPPQQPVSTSPHLDIRYIQDITDTTKMDPLFIVAFSCKIAATICESLMQSNAKKKTAMDEYNAAILEARRANSFDDVSEQFPIDYYLSVRF